MKGDRLYIFRCGCMVYELTQKHKGRWVCSKHEKTLKKIHAFCEVCGLDMEFKPKAAQKKLCDYTTYYMGTRGKLLESKGCAGLRQRELGYKHYRKHNMIILKSPSGKCGKVNERLQLASVRPFFKKKQWGPVKTPVIDKLYREKVAKRK